VLQRWRVSVLSFASSITIPLSSPRRHQSLPLLFSSLLLPSFQMGKGKKWALKEEHLKPCVPVPSMGQTVSAEEHAQCQERDPHGVLRRIAVERDQVVSSLSCIRNHVC
jgi:hypothetical protein